MDNLIVVACHNNIDLLKYWVESAPSKLHFPENSFLLLIDTCSDDPTFLAQWKEYRTHCQDQHLLFDRTEQGNFATGAYWWAFCHYNSTHYIFLHDSVEIVEQDLMSVVNDHLVSSNVVVFYEFRYDHYRHDYCIAGLDHPDLPTHGIFGPMFATSHTILEKISSDWMTMPTCKEDECAWERRWAILFKRIGCTRICISAQLASMNTLHEHYPHIKKTLYCRS